MKNKLAFISESKININGLPSKRLMAVYHLKGCEKAMSGDKCTMCGFDEFASSSSKDCDAISQHKLFLNLLKKNKYAQADILTIGNFFNDNEVSPSLRKHFLSTLSKIPSIKRVLIESRREYVDLDKLRETRDFLRNDQRLVFAFGYESSNKRIRNDILNKSVSEKDLTDVIKLCKQADTDLAIYILIKPHTLTEAEAIKDASRSAIDVLKKAKNYGVNAYVAFEPVFVPHNTILDDLFRSGKFTPPKLWTVIETVILTAQALRMKNTRGRLFIGLSDENLSKGRFAHNCGKCDKRILKAIQQFNFDQDVEKLKGLTHSCKKNWLNLINE